MVYEWWLSAVYVVFPAWTLSSHTENTKQMHCFWSALSDNILLFFVFRKIESYGTVKLRSLEVVGTIFTSPNHLKCELNSYFRWFWLVKTAPIARIWRQKDKKRNVEPADVFENTTSLSYPCSSYRGLTVFAF